MIIMIVIIIGHVEDAGEGAGLSAQRGVGAVMRRAERKRSALHGHATDNNDPHKMLRPRAM